MIKDVTWAESDVLHAQVASERACSIGLLRAEVDPDGLPVRCPLGEAAPAGGHEANVLLGTFR